MILCEVIMLSIAVLSITSLQRWQGLRLINSQLPSERWFIAAIIGTAVAIVSCLIVGIYNRLKRQKAAILLEKSGFHHHKSIYTDASSLVKPGSRQISIGKTLYITSLKGGELLDFEAVVNTNEQSGLAVETKEQVVLKIGEPLSVRYYIKDAVWEFETSLIRRNGNVLFIGHNDNIRFVNRRRFLRVPVNEPAYIAKFPFAQPYSNTEYADSDDEYQKKMLGPPKFVSAEIIELAGPGLRVSSPLKMKAGERVLVVFKLTKQEHADSTHSQLLNNDAARPAEIIEDIGLVRHSKVNGDVCSLAIELTGLTDSNLSEMVRATNYASRRGKANIQDISSAGVRQKKKFMADMMTSRR
jgi:hypothetical protein